LNLKFNKPLEIKEWIILPKISKEKLIKNYPETEEKIAKSLSPIDELTKKEV
jgi:hypothetical protein